MAKFPPLNAGVNYKLYDADLIAFECEMKPLKPTNYFIIMKRLLLLIIAIVFCNPSAYAKIKTVKYKSEGRTYMAVKGNFDKGILVDGKVSIKVSGTSEINGKYVKGKIIGEFRYGGFIVEVQGSISNNKNGGILTKCKPRDWRCDLRTKVTIPFYDSCCSVPATATHKTPPINITGKSTYSFERSLDLALRGIKRNIDNQKKKISNREYYSATITYKGGLIYKGYTEIEQGHGILENRFTMPRMEKGTLGVLGAKLIWPNGDTFEGGVYNFNDSCSSGPVRPYCGTIKFHDGQVLVYDCRKFDDFKIGDNGLCVSPSEMRERFENTIKEREEARLRKIREEREREIREEEERKAAELKAKQEAEQEKREKEIARKNELIRKYGQKYGEAIFNGEPKTGMTIKMVQDIHHEQGRMSRRISQGREITILTYGGDYVSFGGISSITPRYEYTFVNGKLIEFSSTDGQTSIYW